MPGTNAKSLRFVSFAAIRCVLILLFATGCLRVPVHVSPQVEGAGGKGTLAEPATIQAGKSTRAEVERSWKWCVVPTNLERLFLCKVNRSTSRDIQSIMLVPLDASREWEEQFLFVEFDERSAVSKTYFVSNSRLIRALVEWINRNPQSLLDLAQPIALASSRIELYRNVFTWHGVSFRGSVQLRPDSILLEPTEGSKSVELRANQLRKLILSGQSDISLLVGGLPTKYSHLLIALDMPERITFLRYLQQVQPLTIPSPEQAQRSPK